MILPDDEILDFDRLLSTLCDSELTPVQLARLNQLLKSEPDLQRRYVLYMGIHATLRHTFGEDLSFGPGEGPRPADIPGEGVEVVSPRISRTGRLSPFGKAVAAILLLAGFAGWAAWRDHRPAPAASRPRGPVVARVSRSAGARFDPAGLSAGLNEPVHAGEYRLVEGIVQMTFARGAEVLISAPAVFAPESEGRLLLRSGKLSANVPGPARGFVVETPSATLTDLGTEFALDVDQSENGEVHVFRGEVIVQPRSRTDLRPVRLVGSHATRIDFATATPSGIDVDPGRFLRQFDEPETAYSRLARDLGPQIYLGMGPTLDGHMLIDTGSPGSAGLVQLGPDCGTPWSPGRFGASLRLRGPGSGDHAVVPFRPEMVGEAMSVAAWVLAESRPRWASIVKRWGKPEDHCFHFGLFLDDGDLEVHTAQADGREFIAREGRPLPAGRWQHVAFVAGRHALILYRNGVEVARTDYPGLRPGSLAAIGVGAKLDVEGKAPDPIEPGFWDGRLDEIAIYPRALDSEEIRRLYVASGGLDTNEAPDVAIASPRAAAEAPRRQPRVP
jgi:hypothetical protein